MNKQLINKHDTLDRLGRYDSAWSDELNYAWMWNLRRKHNIQNSFSHEREYAAVIYQLFEYK